MTTVRDLDLFMTSFCPKELSEPWDNDGVMLCGSENTPVTRVLVCLEVTPGAIERAIELRADAILTHHPFVFHALRNIRDARYRDLDGLIRNGISVLSYHTRLDKTPGGVNDVLASVLELQNVETGGAFLRVGTLKTPVAASVFADYLRTRLGGGPMRATFEPDAVISRVAVCGGAGKDFLPEAARLGVDAYVTADLSHNAFLDAKDLGVALYDAGHYDTEKHVVPALCRCLSAAFPDLSVEPYDVGRPFAVV